MNGWQTIETAPKDGTEILGAFFEGKRWFRENIEWDDEFECWVVGWDRETINPSHWMPLPPPPENNTKDGDML